LFAAATVIGVVVCPVFADITDINSWKVETRIFNDYPDSNLVVVENFSSLLSFAEDDFGEGGYANMHAGWFSSDGGATRRKVATSEAFDIRTTALLDAGSLSPRKEAGFRFNTPTLGEALFIITSDGEVAAFGANFPFYKFGDDAYEPGTEVEMGVIYRPANKTIEYLLGGSSSGELNFAADFPDWIDGTEIALYGQFAPDDSNPSDFGLAVYTDTTIQVPEPTSIGLLLLAALAALRGSRRG
jgi:hypothetical protein